MYHEVFEYYHNKYVCMLQHVTPPECHMPPSPRLLFQPTTCFCVSCSLRPRLLRPRLPLLFCPLALPRSGARVFDSLALRFRCCALGLGTCEKEDSNNNNDALLSQTWVIATTAVLRVRTVPDVEPHTPGMTSPGLFSSCGRAPARRCCGAAHDVPHAWLAQEAPPGGSTLPTPQERAHCPLGSSPCSPRAADRSTNNITRARYYDCTRVAPLVRILGVRTASSRAMAWSTHTTTARE
jgi:hypothetical protein